MLNIKKSKIRQFRKRIENSIVEISRYFPLLKHFPKGCCKMACQLLAQYLVKNGIFTKDQIKLCANGVDNKKYSHAWLLINNIIVDITPDQFKGENRKVVIAKRSIFHNMFRGDSIYEYTCFMKFSGENKSKFNKILCVLDK